MSASHSDELGKGGIRDWLVVVLLTAAMIFSFVDRFTLSLLVEPIKADLGIGDAELGLLNGVAFGLFYAAMGLPLGWLADRWSRKGTILVGVGMWTVATAACGLANSFAQLLVARIGVGAGEAGLAPASYGIIHDRFPRRVLSRAMSVFQLGSIFGAGAALAIAGALYELFLAGAGNGVPLFSDLRPWQQTFVAVAAPGIVFIGLLSLIGEPERAGSGVPSVEKEKGELLRALREKPSKYALLFFAMSGAVLATYAMLSWFPAILIREHGLTAAQVGKTYGFTVIVAGPAGLVCGGILSDWLVGRGVRAAHLLVGLTALILGLPFAFLLSGAGSAAAILALAAVLHFVLALPIGVIPAYIQIETAPRARGQVSALYVLVVNLVGLGLGPVLIGFVSSLSPDQPTALRGAVVLVIVPSLVLGMILMATLVSRERRRLRNSHQVRDQKV